MADRNPARLAAPLALLAAIVAIVVVVQASGSDSPGSSSATRPALTQPVRHVRVASRVYVVKAGDTLTVIADKSGVSLETIQRLNPRVDPNALQTGQRLKLTP